MSTETHSTADSHELREENQSLWLLTFGPLLWAAHFLACYVTAAVWCAKFVGPDGSLTFARYAIGIYTAIALAGIVLIGWRGYRIHSFGGSATPHDQDTPEDRHRFLGFATLLLAGLSAVGVLYAALPAIFFRSCS